MAKAERDWLRVSGPKFSPEMSVDDLFENHIPRDAVYWPRARNGIANWNHYAAADNAIKTVGQLIQFVGNRKFERQPYVGPATADWLWKILTNDPAMDRSQRVKRGAKP